MRLSPCSSCDRPIQRGTACPFCGARGVPTTSAPRAAALLLTVPLLGAACKDINPPEPAYGGPDMVDPPPPGPNQPEPEKPTKADPPAPSEPQNEIYGTPEMMDPEAPDPKAPEEPAEPEPK